MPAFAIRNSERFPIKENTVMSKTFLGKHSTAYMTLIKTTYSLSPDLERANLISKLQDLGISIRYWKEKAELETPSLVQSIRQIFESIPAEEALLLSVAQEAPIEVVHRISVFFQGLFEEEEAEVLAAYVEADQCLSELLQSKSAEMSIEHTKNITMNADEISYKVVYGFRPN